MISVFNTLTKSTEEIKPAGESLKMFVCGPTVYDYIHIGNARTFVVFDMVAKYLRWRGMKVIYIQNITDIDDKIIQRAKEKGENFHVFAERYEKEFLIDAKALGITAVDQYRKATDYIEAIVAQVNVLLSKGYAYEIKDGIYYDLSKFSDYGKLSGRKVLAADDGVSRIDENPEKRNPGDFCLWKRSAPDEPTWHSPWFPGRPGWHIEDTAITETVFGPQYDLHGGGRDLMFPHHEAEIAQQEAASGLVPFVRYWMHVEFLINKDKKMSKSLGNFNYARDLLKDSAREVLRFHLLSAHYRTQLDISPESLAHAEAAIVRIQEFLARMKFAEEQKPLPTAHQADSEINTTLEKFHQRIVEVMDDDFNTAQAIAILFEMIRVVNQYLDAGKIDMHSVAQVIKVLDFYESVMGIIPTGQHKIPEEVNRLIAERQAAKEAKDYGRADELRAHIEQLGWHVDDTAYGPLVKRRS